MKRFWIILLLVSLLLFTTYSLEKKREEGLAQEKESFSVEAELEHTTEKEEEVPIKGPYLFEQGVIHAVTTKDAEVYETSERNHVLATLKRGTNISILAEQEDGYTVSLGETQGFIAKENAKYFTFHEEKRYTLGSDVSAYNYHREFQSSEDYELYLLENDFNYVIIRIRRKRIWKAR